MELINVKDKILEEIALMALTYRVSYKNIAKMFNTTEIDVKNAFGKLDCLTKALHFLEIETMNEDEINEKVAFSKAKNYWQERNSLIMELNNSSKKNNKEEINFIKDKLILLRQKIDDSIIKGTIGKNYIELTQIELESMAKFRLKYYEPLLRTATNLKRNRNFLTKVENAYAENNPIFAEKLELLNSYYQNITNNYSRKF